MSSESDQQLTSNKRVISECPVDGREALSFVPIHYPGNCIMTHDGSGFDSKKGLQAVFPNRTQAEKAAGWANSHDKGGYSNVKVLTTELDVTHQTAEHWYFD